MSRGVQTQLTEEAKRLLVLAEKATPGPWQEDGTIWYGKNVETDASANDGEDWITFKSRRADEDRAFWIAARELAPALADAYLALLEAAQAYVDAEVADTVALGVLDEGGIEALNAQQIARHKADEAFEALRAAVSVGSPETRETEE